MEKGQKYIKKKNGLKFIIIEVNTVDVTFHEEHYFNPRVMNIKDFLEQYKLEIKVNN